MSYRVPLSWQDVPHLSTNDGGEPRRADDAGQPASSRPTGGAPQRSLQRFCSAMKCSCFQNSPPTVPTNSTAFQSRPTLGLCPQITQITQESKSPSACSAGKTSWRIIVRSTRRKTSDRAAKPVTRAIENPATINGPAQPDSPQRLVRHPYVHHAKISGPSFSAKRIDDRPCQRDLIPFLSVANASSGTVPKRTKSNR